MKKELTKQDILDLFAASDKRFEERMKKREEERAISDKRFDESMKKLSKQIGNIGNNNGDVAEDFFFNGLASKKKIGEMSFDIVEKKVKAIGKKLEGEYDIILTNSDTVVITEVKYKFHPDDVAPLLDKKIPNFKKLFPQYKDFKIYGAIAGLAVPNDTMKSAIEKGFFVLTQSGDSIKLLNDKVKCY